MLDPIWRSIYHNLEKYKPKRLAFDVKRVKVQLALSAPRLPLNTSALEKGGTSLLVTQQMSAILPTVHFFHCCPNAGVK